MILLSYSFVKRYRKQSKNDVADSAYGSKENYQYMEEADIAAYVKYNRFHREQHMHYELDLFIPQSLYYNAKDDYYVCPMGRHMERVGTARSKTESRYVTESTRYKTRNCEK